MRFPSLRFLALWLILGFALPSPVFGLRPGSGIDAPGGSKASVRTGLEEALRPPTPAVGAEEVKAQITRATDESFWNAFNHRLTESQHAEVMIHLQRARELGKDVGITAVAGLTDFHLHTDPGLAGIADGLAKRLPVEGIRFEVSGKLRDESNMSGAIQAPGLIIPDQMIPPFVWPEGSRPPVRVTEAVYAVDMAGIRPAGWIALSYDPTLTIQHILSQDVLLITIRDDEGTAVLAFA